MRSSWWGTDGTERPLAQAGWFGADGTGILWELKGILLMALTSERPVDGDIELDDDYAVFFYVEEQPFRMIFLDIKKLV